MRPHGPTCKIYRRLDFGGLADFAVLDDRQYRRTSLPVPGERQQGRRCAERADRRAPHHARRGAGSAGWLDGFAGARSGWNVLVQQTLMAQFGRRRQQGRPSGPTAGTATRLRGGSCSNASARASRRIRWSSAATCTPLYVANLKPDFDDPNSPVVAAEICGTSITSYGPSNRAAMARQVSANPHVLYGNGWTKGYIRMALSRGHALAELRGVVNAKDRDSAISTVAKFAVEDGKPGVTTA